MGISFFWGMKGNEAEEFSCHKVGAEIFYRDFIKKGFKFIKKITFELIFMSAFIISIDL